MSGAACCPCATLPSCDACCPQFGAVSWRRVAATTVSSSGDARIRRDCGGGAAAQLCRCCSHPVPPGTQWQQPAHMVQSGFAMHTVSGQDADATNAEHGVACPLTKTPATLHPRPSSQLTPLHPVPLSWPNVQSRDHVSPHDPMPQVEFIVSQAWQYCSSSYSAPPPAASSQPSSADAGSAALPPCSGGAALDGAGSIVLVFGNGGSAAVPYQGQPGVEGAGVAGRVLLRGRRRGRKDMGSSMSCVEDRSDISAVCLHE